MKVSLIAITKPTNEFTAQELLAYCARVSNPKNQENHDTADKLLRYMIREKHWSPFEMAHAVIEIITTRDIARQILRHRSFSFQEFSQRYAAVTAPPVYREARLQDEKNRQNSVTVSDDLLEAEWHAMQSYVYDAAKREYEAALSKGIAKEVARAVLPEGLTESRLYMSGSIRSWIHYIQLRSGHGTQKEHIEIAVACGELLKIEFPFLEEVL